MNKILIIGQAPAIRKQSVPYDTTMLYTMLDWVGISKDQAQIMFEFEALTDEFPGLYKKGHHAKPTKEAIAKHWSEVLENKVICADKVWLLGTPAKEFFYKQEKRYSCNLSVMESYHPSRRNYSKIMAAKEDITKLLNHFING